MLKFIHFSDSHLGFNDLDNSDDEGKNIREEDVYRAFSQAVDIILREKPDFVLHTGDLFHRASPTNRTLLTAFKEISRISNAGIPLFIIAGNHDYPKTIFTPAIHELYKLNGNVTIANSEKLEVIERDKYIIHLLPHINNEARFLDEVFRLNPVKGKKPNILATHLTIGAYFMDELGERVFPKEHISILKEFDYVALGHWHKFQHLKDYGNAYYAGATERTAETQTGYDMGVVKVTIEEKTEVEFLPLNLRTYRVININNCYTKTVSDIVKEVEESVQSDKIEGGIFKVYLNSVGMAQTYDLGKDKFAEIFNGSLYFTVIKKIKDTNETVIADSESFDLKSGFLEELRNAVKAEELEQMKNQFEKFWNEIEEEEANANQ